MKKLIILISGLLFLNIGITFSQTDEDRINFFDGVFFLAEEDYSEALSAFQKVYLNDQKDNANLNYLMGVCALKIKTQKENAVKYLEKAVTDVSENYSEGSFKQRSAPITTYLLLGNAYRVNEELEMACTYYDKYLNNLNKNQEYEANFAKKQLENCERAKIAIQNPVKLKKENIGNLYNSRFNNYNMVKSGNGEKIAYMSEQRFYDAINFVELTNNKWSNPINITPQIQSDGDQYVTSLSYDGTMMFLSRINLEDADIMVSTYEAKRWSKSKNIGKPVNTRYFESHASISRDGKKLYFLSNRKESLGGMDIFSSDLLEDGKSWSDPVNLGSNINTNLNEDSPFISNDGKTLYFSSQGHENIGGYDLFYSKLDDNNSWSTPIPYPYPLNTTDDDIFFFPVGDGDQGYMAIIEADGMGGEDIYNISIVKEEILAETEKVVEVKEKIEEKEVVEKEVIEKVVPSVKYYIKPVFFGFDKYDISDIAKSKLGLIKDVMDVFPELILEISAHTDSKGPESYNLLLSNKRANSIKNHLVNIGVDEDRLILKAYGEKKPVAINQTKDGLDSAEGRKFNRRVEFKIKSDLNNFIIFESVEVPDNMKIK